MSVTEWHEIHNGRDGDVETGKYRTVRRYTRMFRATTDSNADDAYTIRTYVSCPRIGDAHNNDPSAWCRKVTPRNESFSKKVWIVTCLYSSEFELSDNPLNDPAEIDWEATTFTRPYYFDKDGAWILTTAGGFPNPPLEGDDARWVVNVRKNLAAVPTWVLTYKNTVNSAIFTLDGVVIAARQAKLSSIKISAKQERNDSTYRVVSFAFHLADDGDTWDKKWLNQGVWAVDPLDAEQRVRCTDKDGAFLDSGMLDADGLQIDDPSPENVVTNTDKIYKEKDFSSLPIT